MDDIQKFVGEWFNPKWFVCFRVQKKAGHWSQVPAWDSWIQSIRWRDWHLHCTIWLSSMDTSSIFKLIMELIIPCVVKKPGSKLGNWSFSQWRTSINLQMGIDCKYVIAELDGKAGGANLKVVITNVPQLNLLGRQAMMELGLTYLTGHFMRHM